MCHRVSTDPRQLGTRSLYLVNCLLGSWGSCVVRSGKESKGQQNLDPPLVWSLPRSFSWTSGFWSFFLSSPLYIHFQIRDFSSSWAALCCSESGSFQSWIMSFPLLKSLWMSTLLPTRPSVMGHGLLSHSIAYLPSCTHACWQFSEARHEPASRPFHLLLLLPGNLLADGTWLVSSFLSGLYSLVLPTFPTVSVSPSPAPCGGPLCLFGSLLYLQNLE